MFRTGDQHHLCGTYIKLFCLLLLVKFAPYPSNRDVDVQLIRLNLLLILLSVSRRSSRFSGTSGRITEDSVQLGLNIRRLGLVILFVQRPIRRCILRRSIPIVLTTEAARSQDHRTARRLFHRISGSGQLQAHGLHFSPMAAILRKPLGVPHVPICSSLTPRGQRCIRRRVERLIAPLNN